MNAIKKEGKYFNKSYIKMKMTGQKAKGIIKEYIAKKNSIPTFEIPRLKIDKDTFKKQNSFVWLGHSTILGNIDDVSFVVDPMLSKRASPLNYVGPKRFYGSITPIDELPTIDLILITHNHYDHMDKKTLLALKDKVKMIYVPLDNAKILIKWGIEKEKIVEFDWYEDVLFHNVLFSFCPTQHFSGRSLSDRDNYLWGSWAVNGKENSIYISGDSGYNEHFKEIGAKFGSFDIACIECGAYNDNWSEVHMTPEESVQASLDLNAKIILPMHWAGFDLSTHSWDEPITRAHVKAEYLQVTTTTPMIGQVNSFNKPIEDKKWWKN